MNRNLLLSLVIFFCNVTFTIAQGNWCGFDQRLQQELNNNPAFREELEKWRKEVQTTVEKLEMEKTYAGVLQIIPVVVHVIHDNGKGNISEAQIKDGIRVMNEDFMRTNADTGETREIFKPHAGVADFEFRLATIDPNGGATNGIVRINSQLTYDAGENTKSLSYWNSSKYFNIWLVNSISGSSGSSTILGYAQFPGWNWSKYGVIMLHTQFGRFGTSSSEGRTATHEVGHCLNLYHTFQDGCGGSNCNTSGDDVCDTPPVDESTWGCSFNQNQCSNDVGGASPFTTNVEDQIENYMSYDDCQNMFSIKQIVRMKAAIANNTPLQNLISTSNLDATGVNSLLAADFYCPTPVVCVGDTVEFSDFSFYGQNGWTWSFPGGNPSTSNLQNPAVSYSAPGLYSVSLTATDGSISKTKNASNYILVVSSSGNNLPLSEDFESITIPDNKWFINNPDNDANFFEHTNETGFSGNSCIKLNNAGNSIGKKDELIVGSFDFSKRSAASIEFKTAYAQKDSLTKDKLMVYISTDCGKTWAPRFAKLGSTLASAPVQISPFTPSDSTQWKANTATLSAAMLKENVMIKFVFESGEGNNFYLDDINIIAPYKTPVLKLPYNNSVNQPDSTKVDWMSFEGVNAYELQMDTSINFNSPLLTSATHAYISNNSDGQDTEHRFYDLLAGTKYYWRVRAIIGTDTTGWSGTWNFTVSFILGDKLVSSAKYDSFKMQVYPNPLNEISIVKLFFAEDAVGSLEAFDITGKKLLSLAAEKSFSKGEHQFILNRKDLPRGLLLLKLDVDGKTSVQKLIVE